MLDEELGSTMSEMVWYIFGLIGAIVLSLMVWNVFFANEENTYRVMSHSLVNEWNIASGDNGELLSSYKDKVWNNTTSKRVVQSFVEE